MNDHTLAPPCGTVDLPEAMTSALLDNSTAFNPSTRTVMEMPKRMPEKNSNRILCVYHSRDLDGWMSAAIVKKWFIEDNHPNKYLIDGTSYVSGGNNNTSNSLDFLGYDYGDEIPDTDDYDKVIMCDVSFPMIEMSKMHGSGLNITWIDHHSSAINNYRQYEEDNNNCLENYSGWTTVLDTKKAACELTWEHLFTHEKMPELVRLLGRYDCFGHKGTSEEEYVLEFQYGARHAISDYREAYAALKQAEKSNSYIESVHSIGKSIYMYLCTEAKNTYKRSFSVIFSETTINEDGGITSGRIRNFITVNRDRFNPVNFGIDYHEDGYDGAACFWYKEGKWHWSLYNDNGEVDCSQIAKNFGGGGHKGAAGFVMEDFSDMAMLLKYNEGDVGKIRDDISIADITDIIKNATPETGLLGPLEKLFGMKTVGDPVKNCSIYKESGCAHVDGPLCNIATCDEYLKQELWNLEELLDIPHNLRSGASTQV